MKKPLNINPRVLEAMPLQIVQSVEGFVKDIVADQAIEGYICTPEEVARLTEKVRQNYAEDIARAGGIVTVTLQGRQESNESNK